MYRHSSLRSQRYLHRCCRCRRRALPQHRPSPEKQWCCTHCSDGWCNSWNCWQAPCCAAWTALHCCKRLRLQPHSECVSLRPCPGYTALHSRPERRHWKCQILTSADITLHIAVRQRILLGLACRSVSRFDAAVPSAAENVREFQLEAVITSL